MANLQTRLNALDIDTKMQILDICEELNILYEDFNYQENAKKRHKELMKELSMIKGLKLKEEDVPIIKWKDEIWNNKMKKYGLTRRSLCDRVGVQRID